MRLTCVMKIVNLTNDVSSLFYTKFEIEHYLTEKEELEKPMELNEFVDFLNMPDTIYCTGDIVIPFAIFQTPKETYLFIVEEDTSNIDKLVSALDDIEWNVSNLIAVSDHDLYLNNVIGSSPYFVIKGKPSLRKKDYTPSNDIKKQVIDNIMKNLTDEDIKQIVENGFDEYRKKLNGE